MFKSPLVYLFVLASATLSAGVKISGNSAAFVWNSEEKKSKIVISPDGSDSEGNGSEEKPYATLERALNDLSEKKFIIFAKAGLYEFRKSAVISGKLPSKILIIGERTDSAQTEFTGSKRIYASKLAKVNDPKILSRLRKPSKGVLYSLDLKKYGLSEYGKMTQRGFAANPAPMQMEAFFSASRNMRLARYPNGDELLTIGKVIDIGYIKLKGWRYQNKDMRWRGGKFVASHEIPETWLGHDDIWLAGTFSVGWADDHQRVKSIDKKTGIIELQYPTAYGVLSSQPGFIETDQDLPTRGYQVYNLLEEIDEPYEYYIDRKKGVFYVMLPDSPRESDFFDFSILESPILEIKDAKNVLVSGIEFSGARFNGFVLGNSNRATIMNCSFKNFGAWGAQAFGNPDNPKNEYTFLGCKFTNNGTGGLQIVCGDRKTLASANNTVKWCSFVSNCRIKKNYSPGLAIGGVGTKVEYCHFQNGENQLLTFSGNDHTISRNYFADSCLNTSDMGCIYTGRNPSNKGIAILNNFFTNIRARNPDSKVCAVYIDDGSGGMNISKNIFCKSGTPGKHNMFAAVFFHGGHDNLVSKNVFIDCDASAGHSPWDDKRWKNTFFKEYLYRLKKEVDIESEPYKKYKSLENFFTTDRERFNIFEGNLLYNSPLPYFGYFKLSNRKYALTPAGTPDIKGEWTLKDVEKYFGNNELVREILKSGIGIPEQKL